MSTRSQNDITPELRVTFDMLGNEYGEKPGSIVEMEIRSGSFYGTVELNLEQTRALAKALNERIDDAEPWFEAKPISTAQVALIEADLDVLFKRLEAHYGRPIKRWERT